MLLPPVPQAKTGLPCPECVQVQLVSAVIFLVFHCMVRIATHAVRLDTLEETGITNKHVGIINLSIFVTYKAACLLVIWQLA